MNKSQGIKLNQKSDFPHKGYSKIEVLDSKNEDLVNLF